MVALQKEVAKRDKALKAAEKAMAAKEARANKTEERLKVREAACKEREVRKQPGLNHKWHVDRKQDQALATKTAKPPRRRGQAKERKAKDAARSCEESEGFRSLRPTCAESFGAVQLVAWHKLERTATGMGLEQANAPVLRHPRL